MKQTLAQYRGRFQDTARASAYAERFRKGTRKGIDLRERRAVERIFSALQACTSVLDVPSGAGRFASVLGDGQRSLIEMDVALPILLHARGEAEAAGVHARCIVGDASRLPLRDGIADAVFCNRLMHHILAAEERALILRELHRVSRRYAVVSFFDYHSFGLIRYWLKRLKGRSPLYEGQPTLGEFQLEVERCGFRMRSIERIGPAWVAQKYFVLEKA